MATIQQDSFTDADGTDATSHSPEVGSWFQESGNMVAQVNGGRLTGSTSQHHTSPAGDFSALLQTTTPGVAEYDQSATVVAQTVLGTRNEIGLAYWVNWSDSMYLVWTDGATWRLSRYDGSADFSAGYFQPAFTTLDSWAQTLTGGQSVAVMVQVRSAGATVLLDGTARLATADVSEDPGSNYWGGVWLFGGTATTGLALGDFLLAGVATGGGGGGDGGGGGGGGGGAPPARRRRVCGC